MNLQCFGNLPKLERDQDLDASVNTTRLFPLKIQCGFSKQIWLFLSCELLSLAVVPCTFRRRRWHPTPVLLPGKSHGQRSLVGCSPWGCEELDTTEQLHFHFLLSCTGEGNGNPLQCSCLENPRDGGAWSMGLHRVWHDWSNLAAAAAAAYLNDLVVFPTFFNLSLNLAIRSSWSQPQSAPSLVLADCVELPIFGCKEYNQSSWFRCWPSGCVHV